MPWLRATCSMAYTAHSHAPPTRPCRDDIGSIYKKLVAICESPVEIALVAAVVTEDDDHARDLIVHRRQSRQYAVIGQPAGFIRGSGHPRPARRRCSCERESRIGQGRDFKGHGLLHTWSPPSCPTTGRSVSRVAESGPWREGPGRTTAVMPSRRRRPSAAPSRSSAGPASVHPPAGTVQDPGEHLCRHRLLKMAVEAGLAGRRDDERPAQSGDRHGEGLDGRVGGGAAVSRTDAVEARHLEIAEDQRGLDFWDQLEGFFAIRAPRAPRRRSGAVGP